MRGLINVLKADPSIEKVYFDNKGGWLLDPNRLHPNVKTREEVLALEDGLPVEDIKPDELASMVEENRLLKEKIELLEMEKTILAEDKAGYEEKIKALEEKITAVTPKNKKFNATT